MIVTYIGIIRFGFSLLFGVALSVSFAGVQQTRKNNIAVACACVILLFVQSACWWLFGIDFTTKLYPLIIHIPMILFLTFYMKRPGLISVVSVLSGYLCCQVPKWIGSIGGAILFGSKLCEHLCYIAAVFIAYFLFQKYVAGTLCQLMEKSTKSCVLLGAVPLFYYFFDYITTIWTDLLYQGVYGAVQFMPSVFSIAYFVFIILYYVEIQKQAHIHRERDLLADQLHNAHSELVSLRQMQNIAASYRHDMRHHILLLQSLAAEENASKVMEYLNAAQSNIDSITPIRFCENETVNMILSSFAAKAKQEGVSLSAEINLPAETLVNETELCSLLSNGLENAIIAAANLDLERRVVSVKALVNRGNLLILIRNPYRGEIVMKDGLPQSPREGHGYGTRSIVAITEAHGGHALFNAVDGVFTLKIMLPL